MDKRLMKKNIIDIMWIVIGTCLLYMLIKSGGSYFEEDRYTSNSDTNFLIIAFAVGIIFIALKNIFTRKKGGD